MAYKIAVASSDGIRVDLSFGAAKAFLIYEVDENNQFYLSETRVDDKNSDMRCAGTQEGCHGTGCGGYDGGSPKVTLVEDCRCVLCSKLGFQIRKQLEKKAVTVFDIDYDIDVAIHKIVQYFDRIDHHQNLKGIAK